MAYYPSVSLPASKGDMFGSADGQSEWIYEPSATSSIGRWLVLISTSTPPGGGPGGSTGRKDTYNFRDGTAINASKTKSTGIGGRDIYDVQHKIDISTLPTLS